LVGEKMLQKTGKDRISQVLSVSVLVGGRERGREREREIMKDNGKEKGRKVKVRRGTDMEKRERAGGYI
jgi:hypothetical protein